MVRKECTHQAIESDPHPFCDTCAIELRKGLCTDTDTCSYCEDTPLSRWSDIYAYRLKRDVRRQAERDRHLNFLHQTFGQFNEVEPTIITTQAAIDAARALVARADAGDFSSSPDSSSGSDCSSIDDTGDLAGSISSKQFIYSSDTDSMGSKKKKEVKEPSAQSKANAEGMTRMTEADAAARMKYLARETQQMKAFMSSKTPADVPTSPPPAPVTQKIRSPPPVSRSHRLSQTRDSSKKRRSRSTSRHRSKKARSPDSTSPKKKPRSSSRKRSTSRTHRRSASGSGSRKRKQRSPSRSQSHDSRKRRSRSVSKRRKASKKQKKRYSYSRSPSSDSSSSNSDSSHYSARKRRESKRRKHSKRRHSRRSRDRSRDRSRRSRSPRKSVQQQRQERDLDLRGQRSPRPQQEPQQQLDQTQQDFNQSQSYNEQQFTGLRPFDQDWGYDYTPPSDDSDAEREIVEPKQDNFPFRDVIEILAKHSDVELADPAQGRGLQFSMASDEVTGPVKPEFAALTTTKGVKCAIALWEAEFLRKDTKRKKPVRKRELFKCDKLRSSLRSYKSGDAVCNMDPLRHERQPYSWLAEPAPKIEVLQTDMSYMELQMRNILRVANFMEVVNQTVNAGFEQKFDEPTMRKLHRCNKHATGDVIKLAANMFCGIATLRKDEILGRSTKIPDKLASQLRHAPIGDVQTLLPDSLLSEIDEVYTHRLSNTTLERAAYGNQRGLRRGGFQAHRGGYQGNNRGGRGNTSSQWNQSEFKRGQHAFGFHANR